ncbi:hypothetical protein LOY54_11990 [Pseudomonas sp. B21-032]|uniref:hypothetical protein n=1 Tax=unclassified Pseudomonas TaxID=196821 RepID=UPI000B2D94BA|nr:MULTISPECIES: hypothetical protein [unclassified Pseudomonas]UVL58614.1 hypothetical protein LOY22_11815 [Pseudomonas sp. B21-035]UVL63947.1 hypothetical protein LOY54_11990 [Pseudomonas sp. B21-032]
MPELLQRPCQLGKALISLGFAPCRKARLLICQQSGRKPAAARATITGLLLPQQHPAPAKTPQALPHGALPPLAQNLLKALGTCSFKEALS